MRPIRLRWRLHLCDIDGVAEHDLSDHDTIVSVCQDCREDNIAQEYLHFPLADDMRSKESWGGSVDYQTFYDAAEAVRERMEHGSVVVHCHAGRNRSVSVCAAVIASAHGETDIDGAFEHIERLRPEADPSPLMEGFARQYVRDT